MKLTQALKLKNRLAGELVRQNAILNRENSRRNDNVSKVDPDKAWGEILRISGELGTLKAKIAVANVPIYSMIERMGELKSRISYLQSLPKREGEEISYFGHNQEKLTYNWTCFLNQEKVDALVKEIQILIDQYQDEIDAFNSNTSIE